MVISYMYFDFGSFALCAGHFDGVSMLACTCVYAQPAYPAFIYLLHVFCLIKELHCSIYRNLVLVYAF